jgi:hypothetical protein
MHVVSECTKQHNLRCLVLLVQAEFLVRQNTTTPMIAGRCGGYSALDISLIGGADRAISRR